MILGEDASGNLVKEDHLAQALLKVKEHQPTRVPPLLKVKEHQPTEYLLESSLTSAHTLLRPQIQLNSGLLEPTTSVRPQEHPSISGGDTCQQCPFGSTRFGRNICRTSKILLSLKRDVTKDVRPSISKGQTPLRLPFWTNQSQSSASRGHSPVSFGGFGLLSLFG